MPRTKVTSTSKDAITDDGNVLISYIDGEQLELQFTAGWLTSLSGVQIRCQVLEAANDASGSRPTTIQSNGVRRTLEIRNADGTAVSGRTYERVRGDSNNYVTVRRDVTNTYLHFDHVTDAIAHEYLMPGGQFQILGSDGNAASTVYTISGSGTNYGYNPPAHTVIAEIEGFSATGSLSGQNQFPASDETPIAVFFEQHHQLSSTGNQFRVVLPEDLLETTIPGHSGAAANTRGWTQRPTPGNAVYGFIGMEIGEAISSGQVQQKWRPLRGQVEVLYSVLDNTF